LEQPTRVAGLETDLAARIAPPARPPLFGLAPGGVCRAAAVAGRRGALLPHRFTLAPIPAEALAVAVSSLWHFPWGRPRRPLAATLLPWSPDFPPPVTRQRPSGQLAPLIRGQPGAASSPLLRPVDEIDAECDQGQRGDEHRRERLAEQQHSEY